MGVIGWINYGERIQRKLGFIEYELPAREQHLIDGWKKSMADQKADIVFFGDSITYGGEWASYFPNSDVCTVAVPGDSVDQAVYRTSIAVDVEPEKIFLLVGVNSVMRDDYTENISKGYKRLLDQLSESNAQIYVQSILPVRSPSEVSNDRIIKVNEILKNIAEEKDCTYLDLHSAFLDDNGELIESYSKDGVHINEEGYKAWVSILEEYMK